MLRQNDRRRIEALRSVHARIGLKPPVTSISAPVT
jgi:hypothetical protein